LPAIIVQAVVGRSLDQKRDLVRRITQAVVDSYGVAPEKVTIRFQDSQPEDFARAGVLVADSRATAES
jgi:4-oxalocrotonate tautomerase